MAYRYKAYTLDKKIVQGTIEATSESMAEEALYRTGYHSVLSLKEVPPGLGLERLLPSLFQIKPQEVIDFSRQLATLVESGVTITTALELLEGQASRAAFKKIIDGLIQELRRGISFSQALSKYPQAFSYTYCQVMKASEQAGGLEVGLRQVAALLEKQAATMRMIGRAITYPAMVVVMAIVVFAVLITVALPPLVELFASLGAELPLITRLLIAAADFLINYRLFLLGGVLVLIALGVGYLRLPSGRLAVDRLMLKIPVIGSINIQHNMCRFCQTTSMLLKAGLRLPQILDIVVQTMGNGIMRQAFRDVREKLVQGQGLSQPMAANDLFPPLLVEMIVVGEKTGNMDSTLATLAVFYEERVDQRINTLISMIEPTLTVVIGLAVGFIALSIITPLYSIMGAMQ